MTAAQPERVREHPAFICAREGHIPVLVLRTSLPQCGWVCPCKRCHRIVEFTFDAKERS